MMLFRLVKATSICSIIFGGSANSQTEGTLREEVARTTGSVADAKEYFDPAFRNSKMTPTSKHAPRQLQQNRRRPDQQQSTDTQQPPECVSGECGEGEWCLQPANTCMAFGDPCHSGMCGAGAWCLQAENACRPIGSSCNNGECGGGAWCNFAENKCYETCYNTAVTCSSSIPRKNIYFCDYSRDGGRPSCGVTRNCAANGENYPCEQQEQQQIDQLPATVAGDLCVERMCGEGQFCEFAENRCKLILQQQPETAAGDLCVSGICGEGQWCDHAENRCELTAQQQPETQPGDLCVSGECGEGRWCFHDDNTCRAIGDDCVSGMCGAGAWCLLASTECMVIGSECNHGTCGGGALCNTVDNKCYETCYNTETTCGFSIRRKGTYLCDYTDQGGRPTCGVTNDNCAGEGDDYPCPVFVDNRFWERSLVADDGDDLGGHVSPLITLEECKQRCAETFECNNFMGCTDGCWFNDKVVTLLDAISTDARAVNVRQCKTFVKGARYFRWRVTETPQNSANFFCANEIEIRDAAEQVLRPVGAVASSQYDTAPSTLHDEDKDSGRFCTVSNGQQGLTGWVRFDMGEPVWAQDYTVYGLNQWTAMPSAWVFESSTNANGPWTELDVQSAVTPNGEERHARTYELPQKKTTITVTATATATTTNTLTTATATLTSLTVTTVTSTLTTFTWTVSAEAVTGSYLLQVADANLFIENPDAELTARQAVASVARVEPFQVTVSLGLQNSRRLAESRAMQAAAGVLVNYSVAVPSLEDGANVGYAISSTSLSAVSRAFRDAAANAGLPLEAQANSVQVVQEPIRPTAPPPESSETSGGLPIPIIAAAGGGGLLILIVCIIVVYCMTRKRSTKNSAGKPADGVVINVEGIEILPNDDADGPTRFRTEQENIRGWALEMVPEGEDLEILGSLLHVPDPTHLGVGKDVRERSRYSKLTLRGAWRIRAPTREKRYRLDVDEVRNQMKMLKHLGVNPPAVRTILDAQSEQLGCDLRSNEKILLHGTKPDVLLSILQTGLNERYTSQGLFGLGLYLAEDPSKTDQYCTADSSEDASLQELHAVLYANGIEHPGREKKAKIYYQLVCRVLLGYPVMTKDGETCSSGEKAGMTNEAGIYATADKRECASIPGSNPPIPHHSLIAEKGPLSEGYVVVRHREFVQFHSQRVLPEYLVAYSRDK